MTQTDTEQTHIRPVKRTKTAYSSFAQGQRCHLIELTSDYEEITVNSDDRCIDTSKHTCNTVKPDCKPHEGLKTEASGQSDFSLTCFAVTVPATHLSGQRV